MSFLLDSIPVVELDDYLQGSPAQRQRFIDQVGTGLKDIGFFVLSYDGLNASLLDQAYRLCEACFALPLSVKQSYAIPGIKGQRGYVGFGKEHAKGTTTPDQKEFWHMGRTQPSPLHPHILPNTWPAELPLMKRICSELYEQLDRCTGWLLEAASLFLGLPPERLSQIALGGDSILRLIHYPPQLTPPPLGALRAAPHEDINLITLLCTATSEGLQIYTKDGRWVDVHANPGQIIVDAGDMLQNLTNGFYRSATHRVLNPKDTSQPRYSMPFFCHPRPEVDLTPLKESLTQTGGLAVFPGLTAGQFLAQRLQAIGLGHDR